MRFVYSRWANESLEDLKLAIGYIQQPSRILFQLEYVESDKMRGKYYKVIANYLTLGGDWEESYLGDIFLKERSNDTVFSFMREDSTIVPDFWERVTDKLTEMESLSLSSDGRPSLIATHVHEEYGIPKREERPKRGTGYTEYEMVDTVDFAIASIETLVNNYGFTQQEAVDLIKKSYKQANINLADQRESLTFQEEMDIVQLFNLDEGEAE